MQVRTGKKAAGLAAANQEFPKTRLRAHAVKGDAEIGQELTREDVDGTVRDIDDQASNPVRELIDP